LDWQSFATVFFTVFVAELGDKTQLATLLYAADPDRSRVGVFVAASAALVLTSAIGVLAGDALSRHVAASTIEWVAGLGFIAIGVWVLIGRG
jgi:putative Ca2+/H+ antiporter (TMEM165/GDT1 family)